MDFSKFLNGFVKVDTWVSLSCYMDLSKLLHRFVKVVLYFSPFFSLGSVVPLVMFTTNTRTPKWIISAILNKNQWHGPSKQDCSLRICTILKHTMKMTLLVLTFRNIWGHQSLGARCHNFGAPAIFWRVFFTLCTHLCQWSHDISDTKAMMPGSEDFGAPKCSWLIETRH